MLQERNFLAPLLKEAQIPQGECLEAVNRHLTVQHCIFTDWLTLFSEAPVILADRCYIS